jgi:Zn-dependent protease with chaperone function
VRYEQLLILATLSTFAVATAAVAVAIAVFWTRLEPAIARLASIRRAGLLFALRASPALAGGVASVVAVAAFLRHEPRSTIEPPGWFLLIASALGMAFVLSGLRQAAVRCRGTRRFLRLVDRGATRVALPGVPLPAWQLEIPFPLVALAGLWRPRLLIARCVLEQMPADELQVVLKHELAHARRRDNVARLILSAMPDALGLAHRLGVDRAWRRAVEDVADDLAAGDDPQARVSLASALVRAAKMAARQPAPAVPLLAFHDGESVERRVRRLVEPPVTRPVRRSRAREAAAAAIVSGALAAVLNADPILLAAHAVIEWMVNAGL